MDTPTPTPAQASEPPRDWPAPADSTAEVRARYAARLDVAGYSTDYPCVAEDNYADAEQE